MKQMYTDFSFKKTKQMYTDFDIFQYDRILEPHMKQMFTPLLEDINYENIAYHRIALVSLL